MWWIIIEAIVWLVLGTPDSPTWKRGRFKKEFGVEYDTVLGRGIQDFLRSIHDVPESWTWQLSIASANKEAKKFKVKYDDGYGQSGVVEIRVTELGPSYRKVED